MVSLARQTERFPNPAGFISGAHLVKSQQKETQWRRDFLSLLAFLSVSTLIPLTRVVTIGQMSAALQR